MNIKEIPWWVCAGLIVFLLILKTAWMRVVEWLIMVGMGLAIVAGIVVVGFAALKAPFGGRYRGTRREFLGARASGQKGRQRQQSDRANLDFHSAVFAKLIVLNPILHVYLKNILIFHIIHPCHNSS